MTNTTNAIDIEGDAESQVFTATRTVRNSDHSEGAIEAGARVFFVRQAPQDGEGVVLAYVDSGEPTNGTQYVVFDSVEAAQAFVDRTGLRAD